jgi:outer membrane protein OmpA-like peptidoglycan-associated protein
MSPNNFGLIFAGYLFTLNKKKDMANLDVQPKKERSVIPWILLTIGALALIVLLLRGCSGEDHDARNMNADTLTQASPPRQDHTDAANATSPTWNDVDFNGAAVNYEEITDKNINVRGNNNYAVYGIGEDILFDKGSASLKQGAETNLQQVATSLNKRYSNGEIRIFGFTDSQGDANANKQLSQQRAETVRSWLIKNGNVSDNKISLHPIGEAQPAASNASEEGRQQNRRVEIVARAASAGL